MNLSIEIEANNNIQANIGQASTKYQRLKQTIINNLMVAGLDQQGIRQDFRDVLERLLPGKELIGVSVTPVGTLKVAIREQATGKVFDIDSLSSGKKGLILTFMLLRRSVTKGGIALIDEPELHLNPAVCKNIIPFLNDVVVTTSNVQILMCTHSAEILGGAFDHPNCSVFHLRSPNDATKIYERDRAKCSMLSGASERPPRTHCSRKATFSSRANTTRESWKTRSSTRSPATGSCRLGAVVRLRKK